MTPVGAPPSGAIVEDRIAVSTQRTGIKRPLLHHQTHLQERPNGHKRRPLVRLIKTIAAGRPLLRLIAKLSSPHAASILPHHAGTRLPLVRPHHPGARARVPAFLSAAPDGLPRLWRVGPDGDRRHLFRQGLPRAVGGVSCRAGVLGGHPLGAEDAARPPGRPDLAAQGRAGVSRCLPDRGQPADHGRPARPAGCHARRSCRSRRGSC